MGKSLKPFRLLEYGRKSRGDVYIISPRGVDIGMWGSGDLSAYRCISLSFGLPISC